MKKIFSFLLIAVLAVVLTGCGDSNTEEEKESAVTKTLDCTMVQSPTSGETKYVVNFNDNELVDATMSFVMPVADGMSVDTAYDMYSSVYSDDAAEEGVEINIEKLDDSLKITFNYDFSILGDNAEVEDDFISKDFTYNQYKELMEQYGFECIEK